MFYIKKLIVTGDGKDASSVEFGPGLNIIHGPSNCGKSYIADCVDYMFGGKQMRIPADLGYDMITMIVSSEKGDITLRRSFDSNDIEVSSLDYRIDSGTYTAGKGSKKKLNIGDVILYHSPMEKDRVVIKRIANIKKEGKNLLFYCLGDNPDYSYDSRYYGWVSSKNFVCRVINQRRNANVCD